MLLLENRSIVSSTPLPPPEVQQYCMTMTTTRPMLIRMLRTTTTRVAQTAILIIFSCLQSELRLNVTIQSFRRDSLPQSAVSDVESLRPPPISHRPPLVLQNAQRIVIRGSGRTGDLNLQSRGPRRYPFGDALKGKFRGFSTGLNR